MKINNSLEKYFFGYGVAVFPLLLLIGPLISEIFLVLTIFYACYFFIKENNYKYIKNKFFLFFFIFYSVILVSTLINFHNFDNSKSAIFYFRIPLFAICVWFILDKFQIFDKKILIFYTILFLIIILDSLFQYYTGKNILGNEILRSRISSFFGKELILGGFIMRLIPLFLVYLIINDKISEKKINFFYLILISLGCLIIYLSGERTSFALLILLFFTIFFVIKSLRKFIIYVMFSFILLAVAVSQFKISNELDPAKRMFQKSFEQITGKGEEQYEEYKKKMFNKVYIFSHDHHGHYILSYQMFKDHPIIGTGVKGFRYLCRNKIYILEKDDGCSTHPHNTYVQILVSTGLIGFIILLIAFGFIIKAIFNCRSEMRKTNIFDPYLASQGIMISTIFVNLWPIVPSGNFFNNWLSMIYFYPIGFYLYLRFKNEKKRIG